MKSGDDYVSPPKMGRPAAGHNGCVLSSTVSQRSKVQKYTKSSNKAFEPVGLCKMPFEERIDTHAHLLPPFYRQACIDAGHEKPDGMPELPVSIRIFSKKLST